MGGIWGGLLFVYILLDVNVRYIVNKNMKVFGVIKNLIDKCYINGMW